jgi:hypothetical protein
MVKPESVRMILAGYAWGAAIIDLVTIAAFLEQSTSNIFPKDLIKIRAPGLARRNPRKTLPRTCILTVTGGPSGYARLGFTRIRIASKAASGGVYTNESIFAVFTDVN